MYICIKKYRTTFYIGMGQVQNGCLYLRYGNNYVIINLSKVRQNTYGQNPLLLFIKFPRSSATPYKT